MLLIFYKILSACNLRCMEAKDTKLWNLFAKNIYSHHQDVLFTLFFNLFSKNYLSLKKPTNHEKESGISLDEREFFFKKISYFSELLILINNLLNPLQISWTFNRVNKSFINTSLLVEPGIELSNLKISSRT